MWSAATTRECRSLAAPDGIVATDRDATRTGPDSNGRKRMRIAAWNIETLAPWLAEENASLTAVNARLGTPDVLCLQEVRIRPQDDALVQRMREALPGYRCHWSLNRDARNGTFRGGRSYGVATYVRERYESVALTYDWDLEGRVCVAGFPALHLAVANVYAVNGTGKAYWDHDAGGVRGDRHAFKQRFVERLGDEMRVLQDGGLRLVLIGDWNVSRARIDATPRLRSEEPHATARRRFNEEFIGGLDLVDILRERNPELRAYTWFNRRARNGRLDAARVDFALLSRSLENDVIDAGIDPDPDARPGSDHAPLWVTVRAPL